MDTKRIVSGTLVGGITLYVVGYLIWGLIFADFFAANAGSATGVARDPQLVWAVALGNLALAALVTLAIGSRPGSATIGQGFKIGAIVGFLLWLGVDFIHYGVTNVSNLTATVVDPLLEVIHTGIGGAVIAAVLGKIATSGRA
ncbi:MAG: hypothetical protein ABI785_06070 [Gemmatimonadales bacterium]